MLVDNGNGRVGSSSGVVGDYVACVGGLRGSVVALTLLSLSDVERHVKGVAGEVQLSPFTSRRM